MDKETTSVSLVKCDPMQVGVIKIHNHHHHHQVVECDPMQVGVVTNHNHHHHHHQVVVCDPM